MFNNNDYLNESDYLKIQKLIGKKLKIIRMSKQITLAQLSYKSGIGENYLSKIENGKVKAPSLKIYLRICLALKIDPLEILNEIYKVISFKIK